MASRKLPNGQWLARFRRTGWAHESATFPTKTLADTWRRNKDAVADAARAGDLAPKHVTVAFLLDKYETDVGSKKPSGKNKRSVLGLIREHLGPVPVRMLTAERIVTYITQERQVEGVTASIDLTYLGGVLKIARSLWRIGIHRNAIEDAREILNHQGQLGKSRERTRRPTTEELEQLRGWFAKRSKTLTPDHIDFILDSGFRPPSELTRLRWADLNREHRTILIRKRKDPRDKEINDQWVPLLGRTFDIILRQPATSEFIFPVNGHSWSSLFPRACAELGIEGLRLYDLRHESISRLVESKLFSIPELMLITGHRDPKMLARYIQLKAHNLVEIEAKGAKLLALAVATNEEAKALVERDPQAPAAA